VKQQQQQRTCCLLAVIVLARRSSDAAIGAVLGTGGLAAGAAIQGVLITSDLVTATVVTSVDIGTTATAALVVIARRHGRTGEGAVGRQRRGRACSGAIVQVVGIFAELVVAAVVTLVRTRARWLTTSGQETTSIRLVVGVLTRGRAVLLDDVDGAAVHRGNHRDVAIGARGAHEKIPRLWIGRLGDARRMGGAHVLGIDVPDGRGAVFLAHVALGQLHALVVVAISTISTTGTARTLFSAVTLCGDAVVSGHGSSAGRRTRAGSGVVNTHFSVAVKQTLHTAITNNLFLCLGTDCKNDEQQTD
jgi:hypothetical protein